MLATFTKSAAVCLLITGSGVLGIQAADEAAAPAATLYERLGGMDGIRSIVRDTIKLHLGNPAIAHYFDGVDTDRLAGHVTAFFAAGSGGPANYQGRDMTSAHAGMGLTTEAFDSAVADVLKAVEANGIGEAEKAEVAAILESLRPAVMGTAGT